VNKNQEKRKGAKTQRRKEEKTRNEAIAGDVETGGDGEMKFVFASSPHLLLSPLSPLVLYFLPLRLCVLASLRSILSRMEY
jgi:hypothetical protein